MNLKDTFAQALSSISQNAGADTVIGESITTANGTTVIPVSKVALGYASGGIDGADKKDPRSQGSDKFIGGGGTGVTVSPVAFLIVSPEGNVELLNVNQPISAPAPAPADPISSVIGAIERSPELIEKFKAVFSKDKKEEDE